MNRSIELVNKDLAKQRKIVAQAETKLRILIEERQEVMEKLFC